MFWRCLLSQILSGLAVAGAVWIVTSIAFFIGLIAAIVTGDWPAFGFFAFFLLAIIIAIIISAIIFAIISCVNASVSTPPPPPTGSGSKGLTGVVDCETAKSLLSDAQAKVQALENALNAEAAKVRAAQDALANARTALTLAIASLAGTFFFPWAIPAALAAVVASTIAVANGVRTLETELAALQQLALQLAAAQEDVAADELLVSQSCSTIVPSSPTSVPLGGITVAGLRRLVSAHI
jgi:hypothetical protein